MLTFDCDGDFLTVRLPSGRKLFYHQPKIGKNKWGRPSIKYKGTEQNTGRWVYLDTYGGKLTENIVQAIARDLLAVAMVRADGAGFKTVMHVHDELICEVPEDSAEEKLKQLESIMGKPVHWAEGLPLTADGYLTPFYKKD